MKIYPILSSDLYALSCVPVSMLERLGTDRLREHLNRDGSLKFLVSQETMGDVETNSGYMSKHVEYGDLSVILAEDFKLDWLQSETRRLSDFVQKLDLDNLVVKIDSLPQPYIVSSFHLSDGHLVDLSGYALSDALSVVVPQVKYASVSADSAVFADLSSPVIDSISAKIPVEASEENQLADKEYVSALVHMNASSFRGTFRYWRDVPTQASGYSADAYGLSAPNYNDYMIIREVNTLSQDGGEWPTDIDHDEKQGTWRFRYKGVWDSDGEAAKKRWYPEYRIEDQNFTPEQMDAINSKIKLSNRVVRPINQPYGGPDRNNKGIYIDGNGEVHETDYAVSASVPSNAKFTETWVLPGEGIKVSESTTGQIISFSISSDSATSAVTGGIRVGRGLTAERTPVVDAATAVKIVEITQSDPSTPEELSGVFGNEAHVGAIMIVKRGYNLGSSASYTGYVYTGSAWEAMAGNCCADNVILKDDIPFGGSWTGSVGNIQYQSGGKFPCGGKSVADAFRMIFGEGNTRTRVAYPRIGSLSFEYDGDQHSPLDETQLDSRVTVGGASSAVNAGNYSLSVSMPNGSDYEWSDGVREVTRKISWKISPISVYLPETLSVYFADEEVSVDFDTSRYGITRGTGAAVNIGNYECELTLSNWPNCVWGDDPEVGASRTITWYIIDPPEEPDAVRILASDGNTYGFKYSKFNSFDGKLAYVDRNGAVRQPFSEIDVLSSAGAVLELSVIDSRLNVLSTCSFCGCSNLVSVDAPYVTDIQESAFADALWLSTANCPRVHNIGAYAFRSAGIEYSSGESNPNVNDYQGFNLILSGASANDIPTVNNHSFEHSRVAVHLSSNDVKAAFRADQTWRPLIESNLVTLHVVGNQ